MEMGGKQKFSFGIEVEKLSERVARIVRVLLARRDSIRQRLLSKSTSDVHSRILLSIQTSVFSLSVAGFELYEQE